MFDVYNRMSASTCILIHYIVSEIEVLNSHSLSTYGGVHSAYNSVFKTNILLNRYFNQRNLRYILYVKVFIY